MNIFTVKNVQMCVLIFFVHFEFVRGFIVKHFEENGGFKATVLRAEKISLSSANFCNAKKCTGNVETVTFRK